MRLDEFDQGLHLLPEPLRQRAAALRPHLSPARCHRWQEIGDALELALMAARYDEVTAAEQLIGAAERLANDHSHGPPPGWTTNQAWSSRARGHGRVARWAGPTARLIAATDASWKNKTIGIGYVVSNGQFGLRGWSRRPQDPTGPSRVLINELRAVGFLLSGLVDRLDGLTVLVDSTTALSYLHRWQAGETTAMPTGYRLLTRGRSARPTLVRLAERLPGLSRVSFQHVKAHAGHPLNEAADALARMARRQVHERFDLRARAEDLVSAFLRDWHRTTAAA
jgi:ribonuclease HI